MKKKLHPKLRKNIYDLSHDKHLQNSHTFVNFGLALWLAMIAGIVTWLIEGGGEITTNLVIFSLIGTSTIASLTYISFKFFKNKRYEVIRRIEGLNGESNKI